jgi:hypothetical protein
MSNSTAHHLIRRLFRFHARAHPRELAEGGLNRFLTHLASVGYASACHVLEQPLARKYPNADRDGVCAGELWRGAPGSSRGR